MFNKWKVLPLVAVFLLLTTAAFADEIVSFKAGYQLLSPEGTLAGTLDGVGTEVDLEKDLNLDDSENVTAEIALKWGDSQFTFNYLPISFSGTGVMTRSIDFNGVTYNIGTSVKTDLDMDIYDVGYTYYLLNFDDLPTRFQLGLELAVKIADINISLNDQTLGLVESISVTAPIPTIGLRARIALADFIGVVGRVGYVEYDGNNFLDAEAQIEFSPIPMVGLYAGYRYFDLKIDEDDVFVETKFTGPFGGLLVRF
ncbi:MAG: hypothetical protein KAU22_03160 [Desulfuromonadales bacterium]|nr:hypothetical protein [Desulfuromonadales bacterium]